jgi:hypothetical protein
MMSNQSPVTRIPSRPSEYNGQRFNSRLETSWAIFFDTHGIEWVYEPHQLHLPTGETYLPDFYLTGLSAWFEVKGLMNFEACAKPRALREVVASAGWPAPP